MFSRSFVFLQGMTPDQERALWKAGYLSWDALLDALPDLPVQPRQKARWRRQLLQAQEAYRERNARWFERVLPPAERWRLIPDFWPWTAFVDVEAYQIRPGQYRMTLAGIVVNHDYRVFVAGRNLHEVPQVLESVRLMISFGGQGFDLQMLEQTYPHWRRPFAHLDLQPMFKLVGLPQGLKKLERMFGWRRGAGLDGMGGWLAVQLWERHREGDDRALKALIRYNFEDVVRLPFLAAFIYNRIVEQLEYPFPPFRPDLPRLTPPPMDRSIVYEIRHRRPWHARPPG